MSFAAISGGPLLLPRSLKCSHQDPLTLSSTTGADYGHRRLHEQSLYLFASTAPRPALLCGRHSSSIICQAEDKENGLLEGAGRLTDGVTDIIKPKFVPRPLAKIVILFYAAGFALSLVKKFLSLALVMGVLGTGVFVYTKLQGDNDD